MITIILKIIMIIVIIIIIIIIIIRMMIIIWIVIITIIVIIIIIIIIKIIIMLIMILNKNYVIISTVRKNENNFSLAILNRTGYMSWGILSNKSGLFSFSISWFFDIDAVTFLWIRV